MELVVVVLKPQSTFPLAALSMWKMQSDRTEVLQVCNLVKKCKFSGPTLENHKFGMGSGRNV